jgi:hypothetical protein
VKRKCKHIMVEKRRIKGEWKQKVTGEGEREF